MANQHSPYRRLVAFRLTRENHKKLIKTAQQYSLSVSEFAAVIIEREIQHIELTPEDYEQIAKEIRAAKKANSN